jgi:hypothetical protein
MACNMVEEFTKRLHRAKTHNMKIESISFQASSNSYRITIRSYDIYIVEINLDVISCDCSDFIIQQKSIPCKHLLYLLVVTFGFDSQDISIRNIQSHISYLISCSRLLQEMSKLRTLDLSLPPPLEKIHSSLEKQLLSTTTRTTIASQQTPRPEECAICLVELGYFEPTLIACDQCDMKSHLSCITKFLEKNKEKESFSCFVCSKLLKIPKSISSQKTTIPQKSSYKPRNFSGEKQNVQQFINRYFVTNTK